MNTPYVDKYWIYTAITRCRDLNNITIYIHSGKEVKRLEQSKIKQYINMKIEGYKDQDKQAGRVIDTKEYVDYKWYENESCTNNCCYHCGCGFELGLDGNSNVFSNITFDRIDNSICHSKGNLVLSCLDCNRKKLQIL